MRKKIICILVALVMCLSIVALTACENFFIPIDNNIDSGIEKEESVKPSNPNNEQTKNPDASQSGGTMSANISVDGKTFVFDTAAVQYLCYMIYPNNQEEMAEYYDDEENEEYGPPSTSEELILEIQLMQEYINEIYAEYKGATMTFNEGKVEQLFADGTTNTYDYEQELKVVYIGYLQEVVGSVASNPQYEFIATVVGVTDSEVLLLELELSTYAVAYIQFVVAE